MSTLKCGLIQMALKGDGSMEPLEVRDRMLEAHIPYIESFYNSLQFSANKNLSRGFFLRANYTYSKSVDDASTFSSASSSAASRQYPLMRTLDRGLSDFDIRHRLVINYFYTLPASVFFETGSISQPHWWQPESKLDMFHKLLNYF